MSEKNVSGVTAAHRETAAPNEHLSKLDIAQENDAVGYREYLEGRDFEVTDKETRRVRWKIDLIVLPTLLVTQALQFMDRTALNYANLFGYQTALGLKGQQFNYLSAGYFFGQYPCGSLVCRYPAQKVIAVATLLWGISVVVMTQCRGYSSAMASRFIIGPFRSCGDTRSHLNDGFLVDKTRDPPPPVHLVFCTGLGRHRRIIHFHGYLDSAYRHDTRAVGACILHTGRSHHTLVARHLLRPSGLAVECQVLQSPRAPTLVAVKRVSGNQTGIKNKSFKKEQFIIAAAHPKMIILFISIFAAAIPNGVVSAFSTVTIRDMGFSTTMTTELKSVGDAVQIVALIIGGSVTLNMPNSRLLTSTAANVLCTVAAAWYSQALPYCKSLSKPMDLQQCTNSSLVSTGYCWSNLVGPFVVKESEAPYYNGATIGLLVGYAIKLGCHIALLLYMYMNNRRRDGIYGPANKEASDKAGMQDKTEFENKDFRYVL
ncbi:putative Major facilitator superfamily domain-containing protein [Seiridium unicorne]|uniref:Major facilitator superfamily domain-containing protein n=1 Tax=Seiridium unicorne TaxID=138068 RepID=A0ABR2UIR9_9PEZI